MRMFFKAGLALALSAGAAQAQEKPPHGIPPIDASQLSAASFDVRAFDPLALREAAPVMAEASPAPQARLEARNEARPPAWQHVASNR